MKDFDSINMHGKTVKSMKEFSRMHKILNIAKNFPAKFALFFWGEKQWFIARET